MLPSSNGTFVGAFILKKKKKGWHLALLAQAGVARAKSNPVLIATKQH